MQKIVWATSLALFLAFGISGSHASDRWGANYFPNVSLTTHEGEKVRFFDDLIKDKVVVINFIYTTCPDICPLETAQLTRVQGILDDRLGKDIFFYSISIDPEHDTPAVLKEYRRKFGAKWAFLTGDKSDIIKLRRKLGLYIEDKEGGENNHNVNMIIGNQATGRWMKRSPFENPYVLADQIGNWLTGWKAPQEVKDYANAPKLRNISDGEKLFRTRCLSCHTIDGSEDSMIGPDLLGITQRRDRVWLINWLKAPDKMLAEKDPIAMELYERFNQVLMPNMRLSQVDIMDLLRYMHEETETGPGKSLNVESADPSPVKASTRDVVAIMNAWVREALPQMKMNAGYMTLVNVGAEKVTLVGVESEAFEDIEVHEMAMVDGLSEMREITQLVIPAGGQTQLKPGGKHLMLMQPQKSFVQGDKVDLTLVFDSGDRQIVSVPVATR